MSASAKGAGLERRASAVLESQGWTVYRAGKVLMRLRPEPGKPPRVISKQHDIFGAYDLIAKKAGEPTRWIQVSVPTEGSRKRAQVAKALPIMSIDHDDIEIWLFVGGRRESGGQRFRVIVWNGFEWADSDAQPCVVERKKAKAA